MFELMMRLVRSNWDEWDLGVRFSRPAWILWKRAAQCYIPSAGETLTFSIHKDMFDITRSGQSDPSAPGVTEGGVCPHALSLSRLVYLTTCSVRIMRSIHTTQANFPTRRQSILSMRTHSSR